MAEPVNEPNNQNTNGADEKKLEPPLECYRDKHPLFGKVTVSWKSQTSVVLVSVEKGESQIREALKCPHPQLITWTSLSNAATFFVSHQPQKNTDESVTPEKIPSDTPRKGSTTGKSYFQMDYNEDGKTRSFTLTTVEKKMSGKKVGSNPKKRELSSSASVLPSMLSSSSSQWDEQIESAPKRSKISETTSPEGSQHSRKWAKATPTQLVTSVSPPPLRETEPLGGTPDRIVLSESSNAFGASPIHSSEMGRGGDTSRVPNLNFSPNFKNEVAEGAPLQPMQSEASQDRPPISSVKFVFPSSSGSETGAECEFTTDPPHLVLNGEDFFCWLDDAAGSDFWKDNPPVEFWNGRLLVGHMPLSKIKVSLTTNADYSKLIPFYQMYPKLLDENAWFVYSQANERPFNMTCSQLDQGDVEEIQRYLDSLAAPEPVEPPMVPILFGSTCGTNLSASAEILISAETSLLEAISRALSALNYSNAPLNWRTQLGLSLQVDILVAGKADVAVNKGHLDTSLRSLVDGGLERIRKIRIQAPDSWRVAPEVSTENLGLQAPDEFKWIFRHQEYVAEKLLVAIQRLPFDIRKFKAVDFGFLTLSSDQLEIQTRQRVVEVMMKSQLYSDPNVEAKSRVWKMTFYKGPNENAKTATSEDFRYFLQRVEQESETLFVVFIDECHTNYEEISSGSLYQKELRESDKHGNVVEVCISATGWNNLTADSEIPHRYRVERDYLDPTSQRTIQAGETVILTRYSEGKWHGFVESELNRRTEPKEATFDLSFLDCMELNVVSWFDRVRLPKRIVRPTQDPTDAEALIPVTVLDLTSDGSWKISDNGTLLSLPYDSLTFESTGKLKPAKPSEARYQSLDRYMAITAAHLHAPEPPLQRPSFLIDCSFELFVNLWNSCGPRNLSKQIFTDKLTLVDYQISMIFVRCFLCTGDTKFSSVLDQSRFCTAPNLDPNSIQRNRSTFVAHVLRVLTESDPSLFFSSSDGSTNSLLLLRLSCLLLEFEARSQSEAPNERTLFAFYQKKMKELLETRPAQYKFFKYSSVAEVALPSDLLDKFFEAKLIKFCSLITDDKLQPLTLKSAFSKIDDYLALDCLWTHPDETVWTLLTRRGSPIPPEKLEEQRDERRRDPNARAQYWWGPLSGPMKIVKVSTNRGAVEMTEMLRKLANSLGWSDCFEIYADVSEKQKAAIRPQFELNMQPMFCTSCKCDTFTKGHAGQESTCRACKHKHSMVETPDDWRCPILLFLNQKGKIGDTYPCDGVKDSGLGLDSVDMRTRSPTQHLAPLVQEFGRLCRYTPDDARFLPYTVVSKETFDSIINIATKPNVTDMKQALLSKLRPDRWVMKPSLHSSLFGTSAFWRVLKLVKSKDDDSKGPAKFPRNYENRNKPAVVDLNGIYCLNHERFRTKRILLDAEPQIGKTMAALYLIVLLNNQVNPQHQKSLANAKLAPEELELALPSAKLITDDYAYAALWDLPYGCQVEDEMPQLSADYSKSSWCRYHTRLIVSRLKILHDTFKDIQDGEVETHHWYEAFSVRVFQAEARQSARAREIFEARKVEAQASFPDNMNSFIDFFMPTNGSSEISFRLIDRDELFLINVLDVDKRLQKSNWVEQRKRKPFNPIGLAESSGLLATVDGPEKRYIIRETSIQSHFDKTKELRKCYPRFPSSISESKPSDYEVLSFLIRQNEGRWNTLQESAISFFSGSNVDQEQQSISFSVPQIFANRSPFQRNGGVSIRAAQSVPAFIPNETLRYWIFTPTYKMHGSNMICYDKVMAGFDYIHVIVVREGEEFDRYQRRFGASHIIMTLPGGIRMGDKPILCREGGCGFAKLAIQLVAYLLGLDYVHIWDDNIVEMYSLDVPKVCDRRRALPEDWKEVQSWGVVAKEFERVVTDATAALPDDLRSRFKLRVKDQPFDLKGPLMCSDRNRQAETWRDYIGETYGIVGMKRGGVGDAFVAKSVMTPFHSRSQSIYSAVLMNVKDTIERGVYYPIMNAFEDMEFLHLCAEKHLKVVRFNKFLHYKIQTRLIPKSSPSENAPKIHCLSGVAKWQLDSKPLDQFSQEKVNAAVISWIVNVMGSAADLILDPFLGRGLGPAVQRAASIPKKVFVSYRLENPVPKIPKLGPLVNIDHMRLRLAYGRTPNDPVSIFFVLFVPKAAHLLTSADLENYKRDQIVDLEDIKVGYRLIDIYSVQPPQDLDVETGMHTVWAPTNGVSFLILHWHAWEAIELMEVDQVPAL